LAEDSSPAYLYFAAISVSFSSVFNFLQAGLSLSLMQVLPTTLENAQKRLVIFKDIQALNGSRPERCNSSLCIAYSEIG